MSVDNSLSNIFDDSSWTTRSVFVKALTTNDDSGRHGVLVPREAYPLFPALEGVEGANPSLPITTDWRTGLEWEENKSFFRQYDRYPERRLTSLEPEIVNRDGDRLFAIASSDARHAYRAIVVLPGEDHYDVLLNSLGASEFMPGANAVINLGTKLPTGSNFQAVLARLIDIGKQGWIVTARAGDTGVGMTLERALGIAPNLSTGPDLDGIELKASRKKSAKGKITLFAKTPNWGSAGRGGLLDEHGYQDEKRDRWALYHSIHGHMESSSGWRLRVDSDGGKVYVDRHGEPVVDWDIATLEASLQKKHGETIFVEAESRGKGESEEFRYVRVTHAASPSIERFLSLIEDGRICQDFAMHRTETGAARDHGFLFRIVDGFQASLFAYIRNYELS